MIDVKILTCSPEPWIRGSYYPYWYICSSYPTISILVTTDPVNLFRNLFYCKLLYISYPPSILSLYLSLHSCSLHIYTYYETRCRRPKDQTDLVPYVPSFSIVTQSVSFQGVNTGTRSGPWILLQYKVFPFISTIFDWVYIPLIDPSDRISPARNIHLLPPSSSVSLHYTLPDWT